MQIPLLDLQAQYKKIAPRVEAAVAEVFASQRFILGPQVARLEAKVAGYCQTCHAIGVASGSDALLLSLMALGVGAGDQVITSPYTFFATAGSISRLGAVPVFVDINPESYNLEPSLIEQKITPHTKAIIAVHLFGQCADMQPILEVADRYDLPVIEDAAQAIGAVYQRDDDPRPAGSMGQTGCFSFFPSKNLGGCGDGGMVVTGDLVLADKIKMLRVHGSQVKYHHRLVGCNSRLDTLQAAVLLVKLEYLEEWSRMRIENARRYDGLFQQAQLLEEVQLPSVQYNNRHVFNQYVIRVKRRDSLREFLKQAGIGTEIYYPIPLHLQECYRNLGYKAGDLPQAETAARQSLALPIYPELTPEMQAYVVDKIKEFYRK
jgi:dTDP-4-amino-4,6-dideoxygalactose transaminase